MKNLIATLLIILLVALPIKASAHHAAPDSTRSHTVRDAWLVRQQLLDLPTAQRGQPVAFFWQRLSPELRTGIVVCAVITFIGAITWIVGKNLIDHKADREGK